MLNPKAQKNLLKFAASNAQHENDEDDEEQKLSVEDQEKRIEKFMSSKGDKEK